MLPDRLTFRWWQLICAVSAGNVLLWIVAAWWLAWESDDYRSKQLALSGLFVAACAFRSLLPRVDLERMCLWDGPLSSVIVGRTVATIAELCFAWQCALLLFKVSALTGSSAIEALGHAVMPIIVVAELACWFAVATLNHIWHAVEELLWSIMVGLVGAGLVTLLETHGRGLADVGADRFARLCRNSCPNPDGGCPALYCALAGR